MGTRPVTIDRAKILADSLAETISNHLSQGETVRIKDSEWPASERLRYIVKWIGEAGHVFDGRGERLGVFAHLDALVAHAERMTA